MGRHKKLKALSPNDLDPLLLRSFDYWKSLSPVCAGLDPRCDHYKLASAMMFGMADFMREISDGKANVAHRWTPSSEKASEKAVRVEARSSADEAPDDYTEAGAEALSLCGGDPLATIKALIIANEYLEYEVARLSEAVSFGYVYGKKRSGDRGNEV